MVTATTRRRRKPILPHPRAEKLSPFAGELTHTCGGIDAGLRLNRPPLCGGMDAYTLYTCNLTSNSL
jgi:hypothetical protein